MSPGFIIAIYGRAVDHCYLCDMIPHYRDRSIREGDAADIRKGARATWKRDRSSSRTAGRSRKVLQNNIASVGVPLFVAKAVTGAVALTGKTPSQFINAIRKKLNL